MKKQCKKWEDLTTEEKVELLRLESDIKKIKYPVVHLFVTGFILAILAAIVYSQLAIAVGMDDIYQQTHLQILPTTDTKLTTFSNLGLLTSTFIEYGTIAFCLGLTIVWFLKYRKLKQKYKAFLESMEINRER